MTHDNEASMTIMRERYKQKRTIHRGKACSYFNHIPVHLRDGGWGRVAFAQPKTFDSMTRLMVEGGYITNKEDTAQAATSYYSGLFSPGLIDLKTSLLRDSWRTPEAIFTQEAARVRSVRFGTPSLGRPSIETCRRLNRG